MTQRFLELPPLPAGGHVLHISSAAATPFFTPFDVTYQLQIIPLLRN